MSLTREELQQVEAVLAYYGDQNTWKRRGKREGYRPAPFTRDHGARARQALDIVRAALRQRPGLLARLRGAFQAQPRPEPIHLGAIERAPDGSLRIAGAVVEVEGA